MLGAAVGRTRSVPFTVSFLSECLVTGGHNLGAGLASPKAPLTYIGQIISQLVGPAALSPHLNGQFADDMSNRAQSFAS